MEEIWKEIEGSLGYAISNLGRLKRLERKIWNVYNNSYNHYGETILKCSTNNSKGYVRLTISYGIDRVDYKVTESIHRLVAKAFIPNPDNKPEVNHKDGVKTNNCVDNLEWCTTQENFEHKYKVLKSFKQSKGQLHTCAKLTEEQVLTIPDLLKKYTIKQVAQKLGVGATTISEIKAGRSWRHLDLFKATKRTDDKYFEYNTNINN